MCNHVKGAKVCERGALQDQSLSLATPVCLTTKRNKTWGNNWTRALLSLAGGVEGLTRVDPSGISFLFKITGKVGLSGETTTLYWDDWELSFLLS